MNFEKSTKKEKKVAARSTRGEWNNKREKGRWRIV